MCIDVYMRAGPQDPTRLQVIERGSFLPESRLTAVGGGPVPAHLQAAHRAKYGEAIVPTTHADEQRVIRAESAPDADTYFEMGGLSAPL